MNNITKNNLEYKQLAEYLLYNLNKDFRKMYYGSKNTVANSIACTGILTLSVEEMNERKLTFIAYELINLVNNGETVSSYKKNQSLVLNTYKNMMIDLWRKQQTERKYIVYLETIYSPEGEDITMTNNIADTTEAYDNSIDQLWFHWATFVKGLPSDQKKLTQYWMPSSGASEKSFQMIANELGIAKTTVQYRIDKLRSAFKAYLIENRVTK